MEIDDGGDESLPTDALDLIWSVIQDQPGLAEELLEALEIGDASSTTDSHPPDLLQLTTMILEEAPPRLASTELSAHATRLIRYERPLSTSYPSQVFTATLAVYSVYIGPLQFQPGSRVCFCGSCRRTSVRSVCYDPRLTTSCPESCPGGFHFGGDDSCR
ncbi:hypothetical protein BKA83DRAFT_4359706 [Pisolithus microcarpus]|nr:hypothetical protein BKA83DRAFT_4359706 [Pisolithus microcarpus]